MHVSRFLPEVGQLDPVASSCVVLTLHELKREEAILLKMDGQEIRVPIQRFGLAGRSFTFFDLALAARRLLGEKIQWFANKNCVS